MSELLEIDEKLLGGGHAIRAVGNVDSQIDNCGMALPHAHIQRAEGQQPELCAGCTTVWPRLLSHRSCLHV